jgi:hypothetical protein
MTKSYWVLLLLILGLAFFGGPVQAEKNATPPGGEALQAPVVLAAPEEPARADGQDGKGDEYTSLEAGGRTLYLVAGHLLASPYNAR